MPLKLPVDIALLLTICSLLPPSGGCAALRSSHSLPTALLLRLMTSMTAQALQVGGVNSICSH